MCDHTHREPLCDSEGLQRSNTGAVIWFELGSVFMFHHKTSIKQDSYNTHTHTDTKTHAHHVRLCRLCGQCLLLCVSHDQGVFSVCVSLHIVWYDGVVMCVVVSHCVCVCVSVCVCVVAVRNIFS